jgi:hypothetical protein
VASGSYSAAASVTTSLILSIIAARPAIVTGGMTPLFGFTASCDLAERRVQVAFVRPVVALT